MSDNPCSLARFAYVLAAGLSETFSGTSGDCGSKATSISFDPDEVTRDRGALQTPVMKSRWQGPRLVMSLPAAQPRAGLVVPLGSATKSGATSVVPSAVDTIVPSKPGREFVPPLPLTREAVATKKSEDEGDYEYVSAQQMASKVRLLQSPLVELSAAPAYHWPERSPERVEAFPIKAGYFDLDVLRETFKPLVEVTRLREREVDSLGRETDIANDALDAMYKSGSSSDEIEAKRKVLPLH
ncbi:MAG: hypothetical protein K2W95_01420 [Candidatus Obscuribacterales bacterium]|nr:hypothetical protein [Candidatus Obscuribacterales bacterium]